MAAIGILRPGDVIFYHPLDDLTENTQSQAWTGTGGFVAGKIANAASAITGDTLAYGTVNAHQTGVPIASSKLISIDSSRVLLAYRNNADNMSVRVGTITGMDITWGVPAIGSSAPAGQADLVGLAMLDSTSFVLAHRTSGVAVRAGAVSGTTVTLGSAATFGSISRGCRIAKIDVTHALLVYTEYSGEVGTAKVVTVSGLNATLGASHTFATDLLFTSLDVEALDSTRYVISWGVTSGSPDGIGYVTVATVSGTDVTFGASKSFTGTVNTLYTTTGPTWAQSVVRKIDSNKCVIVWQAESDGHSGRSVILTFSGNDITVGPETVFMTGGFWGDMEVISSTQFVVMFESFFVASRIPVHRIGTVSGTNITYGAWSSPHSGSGPDEAIHFDVTSPSSSMVVSVATISGSSDTAVGEFATAADIEAPTPGAYPSTIGATRCVAAMWAKNLTAGSSTVTVKRGYQIDMTATSISLGGTTAVWSGAGIAALMSTMNNGASHLLVLDFENTSGTTWTLGTSMDGEAFTPQGSQTSGTQAVTTADTAPGVAIASGESGQWIDELAMWAGDKATFDTFTTQELANLNDLADTFGETMDQFEENFGAPLCWQATATMPDGSVWRDSGNGPCPAMVRVPIGADDIVVTDDRRRVRPRIQEG